MAVSALKRLKRTTADAIKYICKPEKTEGKLLVSSYACSADPSTAALEMQLTAGHVWDNKERVGYHMFQCFAVDDDISPDQAHQLGLEFAQKMLGGQYEFVLATHVDKDHIHNHIVFNSTNFITHKKFHWGPYDKQRMWRINDAICRANNLSVVENESGCRGKSYHEYQNAASGQSWKKQLQDTIDIVIKKVDSFDDFLRLMRAQGYEIKQGKYISFKAPGQERYTRCRRLGDFYSEEMLKARIADKTIQKPRDVSSKSKNSDTKQGSRAKTYSNLIVDLSKNLKAQQSAGYAYVVQKSNMDKLAKTLNFLSAHNIKNPDQLLNMISQHQQDVKNYRNNICAVENKIMDLQEIIKMLQTCKKYQGLMSYIRKNPSNHKFISQHQQEILVYEAAKKFLKEKGISTDCNFSNYQNLCQAEKSKKGILYAAYQKEKEALKELQIIKKNVEISLQTNLEKMAKKEEKRKDAEL